MHASLQLLVRPDKSAEVGEREAAATERRLNTSGDAPHEAILFANHAVTYRINDTTLLDQLTASHYQKCKSFGEIYTAANGDGKYSDLRAKLLQSHMDSKFRTFNNTPTNPPPPAAFSRFLAGPSSHSNRSTHPARTSTQSWPPEKQSSSSWGHLRSPLSPASPRTKHKISALKWLQCNSPAAILAVSS